MIYIDEQGDPKFAHMQWHLELRTADDPSGRSWVDPALSADDQEAVAQTCQLLHRRSGRSRVPLAFFTGGARIYDGRIDLRDARGLNCATLVLLVFEAAGAPLLNRRDWARPSPERAAQDRQVQEQLVAALAKEHPGPAALLKREIGSPRIRPEEVAAASGLTPLPASYDLVVRCGADLRSRL